MSKLREAVKLIEADAILVGDHDENKATLVAAVREAAALLREMLGAFDAFRLGDISDAADSRLATAVAAARSALGLVSAPPACESCTRPAFVIVSIFRAGTNELLQQHPFCSRACLLPFMHDQTTQRADWDRRITACVELEPDEAGGMAGLGKLLDRADRATGGA